MIKFRLYGHAPFHVVLVHGGPGGPGSMASIAKELSKTYGILEPLQAKASLEGQIEELHSILKNNANPPVILIGWSWGAMLSFIIAARYPVCVKKLIIVGSAVFEDKYAKNIMKLRKSRLAIKEKKKIDFLINQLQDPNISEKKKFFADLGKLTYIADSYDPLPYKEEVLDYQYDVYCKVWKEAVKFRKKGEFLKLGRQIKCPVIAIHGDYDPHPFKGVYDPLSTVLSDFKTILLPNCGHYPWFEKNSKDVFYNKLKHLINEF